LLPYPEIVVSSVDTSDASNFSLVLGIQYAYGGAVQVFDAAYDRFVFPGYQRKVTMQYAGPDAPPTDGMASLTDTYPHAPFDPAMDPTARYLRYAKAGRVSDVTTLSGDMGTDVWALLLADRANDARRIAASHSDYSARLLPVVATGNEYCVDMVYPYDYGKSLAYNNDTTHQSFDQCAEHGLALQTSVTSWRGTPGTALGTADVISSPQIVQTSAAVTAFDDFGRVTDSTNNGDLADANDDLCVHVDYATPTPNTTTRVLNAPATRTVRPSCGSTVILAKDSFEYDGLTDDPAVVQVSDGFVTAHIVTRYDMDTHAPLGGDIRLFDATIDPTTGNPTVITRTRDDNINTRVGVNFSYDPYGLVLTRKDVWSTGTNFDTLSTTVIPDPVTLNVTSTTDPNGTVRGTSYDGFGRVLLSKITPPGGAEGVLSKLSYNGFEANSSSPRSIVQKVVTDPVAERDVDTAPCRTGTTTLDSLGRATKTEAQLGADYQSKTVVMGQRTYDLLGRVKFQADPYLSTDSFASAYGTTQFFNTDGTPSCAIRGSGVQQSSGGIADEVNEVFSTCFGRSFANNQEIITRRDPDSFVESNPQSTVSREAVVNAIGRVLERRTKSAREGNPTFEDVTFGYDALGHLTSMKRYLDPANQAIPVTTNWHFDSLGWNTKLEEQGVAAQIRTFDSWGEITAVQWCEDWSAPPCPTADRRYITQFDALGRVTHREDQTNGSTNPETVNDYSYDVGVDNATPPLTAANVLGRLARATSPTSTVSFSYDPFGRVNAQVFTDTTVTPNKIYVEQHDIHGDGSEQTLHLLLADNAFKDERVDYDYDTAGRTKSVKYNDGANQDLFTASGGTAIYDVFGRITTAQYGLATFNATFAPSGRRLLNDVKVTSAAPAIRARLPSRR
jgi:YD repeat-containing protein